MKHELMRGFELGRHIGEAKGNSLMFDDRLAEASALLRIGERYLAGGAGYMTDYGVERIFRAVRASKIYEGTNDIQRLVISRALVAQTEKNKRN